MGWGCKSSDPDKDKEKVCKDKEECPDKKKEVTVDITLSQPVACPGHPLEIKATGKPSGGTYAWTVSGGGAELVDGTGKAVSTGDVVHLRSFEPDDATGEIPEQKATVKVTYTHPDGTATDSEEVPIHKIEFEITNMTVTGGVTKATEAPGSVTLENATGVPTMLTKPKVKIKLDPSCPRKSDCAKNHRAGWLQTVTANTRETRYTHTLVEVKIKLPIRDGDPIAGPSPHPFYDAAPAFTGDNSTVEPEHQDSPGQGATWIDTRAGAPAPPPAKNRRLRKITFTNTFDAWLVVQNLEWKDHDLPGSFAYQRHFTWTSGLTTTVDVTKAVGSRCSPASNKATIGKVGKGKGGGTPDMGADVPNVAHTVTESAAPGI